MLEMGRHTLRVEEVYREGEFCGVEFSFLSEGETRQLLLEEGEYLGRRGKG